MNAAHFDLRPHAGNSTTLMGVLDQRAREAPDRVLYRFLREGELETDSLTAGELRRRALRIAAELTARGATGERALLLYPQGLAFLSAFFGCLYAGVVAVPVSLPSRKRGFEALQRVTEDADAKWLLSTSEFIERFSVAAPGAALPERLCLLASDELESSPGAARPVCEPGPQDPALIQYTSGTTGPARGVVVTHDNLVDNHRQVARALNGHAESVYVSWLPMFHDMGLGIALQAVSVGAQAILMPPRSFVQEPRRWLAAISRYRGTISGGPDFAFELCAARISQAECEGLDLSSWRVAYNGSEPVRAETLVQFSRRFAGAGFRHEAFQPVYGLAEATLLVSSEPPAEPPIVRRFSAEALEQGEARLADGERARPLVSVGRPWPGTRVKIVDPETREECPANRVGEIWIQGRSVAAGYFERESETRASFDAGLAHGQGCFFRSGDLGVIVEGRLFVVGRQRDALVVGDRTYYPQDIEATASQCHAALAPHGAAAFSLGATEDVVVVQEVSRSALRTVDADEVMRAIRAAVRREHGLDVTAVLIKPATLPRTTSGKVQRRRCRAAYLDQALSHLPTFSAAASGASG